MKKNLFLFIILAINSFAFETEYEKGENLYFEKGCANCHGTEAEGNNYYPKLANKKQKILLQKLKDFKNGKASSQKAEIMFTFADSLQDKEMQYITKFLSRYKEETTDKYKISDDILGSVD